MSVGARSLPLLLASIAACGFPRQEETGVVDDGGRLGPFFDRDDSEAGEVTQVRPFYRRQKGPYDQTQVNILGPLIMYREDSHFKRLRAFPNIYYTARKHPQADATWRFLFFPFIWAGDKDFLFFPIGGKARRFLGIDEILMVAGPLYVRSRRITSDKEPRVFQQHNVLWPFFAWGSDGRPNGRRSLRVWPFFGKAGTVSGGKEGYVFWPFYNWRKERDEVSFHLWPFYGKRVTPILREQVMLWPLFHYREDLLTGGEDMAFWPLWRRATGSDTVEVERYWPLYEYRRVSFTTTEYMAWPFFRRTWVDEPHQFSHYLWGNPFFRRVKLYDREKHILRTKLQVWPLVRTDRNSVGAKDVVVPLLLPDDAKLIRDFMDPIRPFTSIYSLQRKPTGETETSAAFGVYMGRKTKNTKQTRLLWGLVGWDRRPEGRYVRLLWAIRFRIGDSR